MKFERCGPVYSSSIITKRHDPTGLGDEGKPGGLQCGAQRSNLIKMMAVGGSKSCWNEMMRVIIRAAGAVQLVAPLTLRALLWRSIPRPDVEFQGTGRNAVLAVAAAAAAVRPCPISSGV